MISDGIVSVAIELLCVVEKLLGQTCGQVGFELVAGMPSLIYF